MVSSETDTTAPCFHVAKRVVSQQLSANCSLPRGYAMAMMNAVREGKSAYLYLFVNQAVQSDEGSVVIL